VNPPHPAEQATAAAEDGFDHLIHAPARLRICAALYPVREIEFGVLLTLLDMSKSALSKHLSALAEAATSPPCTVSSGTPAAQNTSTRQNQTSPQPPPAEPRASTAGRLRASPGRPAALAEGSLDTPLRAHDQPSPPPQLATSIMTTRTALSAACRFHYLLHRL